MTRALVVLTVLLGPGASFAGPRFDGLPSLTISARPPVDLQASAVLLPADPGGWSQAVNLPGMDKPKVKVKNPVMLVAGAVLAVGGLAGTIGSIYQLNQPQDFSSGYLVVSLVVMAAGGVLLYLGL